MKDSSPAAMLQHVAFINRNCQWVAQHGMLQPLSHVSLPQCVRQIVRACSNRGVPRHTLSIENWQRSADHASYFMDLGELYLQKEARDGHASSVRFKAVGEPSRLDKRLQNLMASAQALIAHHSKITLTINANYGKAPVT